MGLPHLHDRDQPSNRSEKNLFNSKKIERSATTCHRRQGDGGSVTQKRRAAPLTDTTRDRKKSSTPVTSDTTPEKGATDKNKATTNRNLAQGKGRDVVRTVTSYFDPVWNAFSKHTDRSIQWIPKQIVAIGEDFHRQVGDGKVRKRCLPD